MPRYIEWLWEEVVKSDSCKNARLVKVDNRYVVKDYDPKNCGTVYAFLNVARLGFDLDIKLDGWDF